MSSTRSWFQTPSTPPNESGQESDYASQKLNLDELPTAEDHLPTRRIHILGTGSIGTLVASALIQLPNPPPISLLIHRERSYDQFKEAGRTIRLVNKATDVNDEQIGFDVDLHDSKDGRTYWTHIPHEPSPGSPVNTIADAERMKSGEIFIYTLIVAVKGPTTRIALKSVKHRINAKTTILLMQNGLGQIDELNEHVFTDPATRPTYMLGIISHGCYMDGPFNVVHAGVGTIALGIYRDTDKFPMPPKGVDSASHMDESRRRQFFPTEKDLYSNISARYLLRTLTRCPFLACAPYQYLDLFQLQLEKLVTNCIINPLTAILDVRNGVLLDNPPLTRVQRLLISEIALVIRGLPELEGIPNVRARFSPTRLELRVQTMTTQTAQNSSSMREDMRYPKLTEIDYINGYIVKRGEEQGIKCVLNYMIMQLIKGKNHILFTGENQGAAPYGTKEIKAEETSSGSGGVLLEDVSGPSG